MDAVVTEAVGVAGVALGDIDLHFASQVWHLATSTSTLRGRRCTSRHVPSLCLADVALTALVWLWWRGWFPVDAVVAEAVGVAGVALGDIDLHFAWQAWHGDIDFHFIMQTWRLRHWAGSGGALGSQVSQWTPWSLRLLAWQAWHLAT